MCDTGGRTFSTQTPLTAIPLLINISVAIISTKIPILLGHDYLRFHVAKLARYGFWSMASEARTDFAMLMGLLFLLIVGAGPWSLDSWSAHRVETRCTAKQHEKEKEGRGDGRP
jgi:uncharacterized membrane protein YphA (DoxX/SURF4 family)